MHRVLVTPEILRAVFRCLDSQSNVNNAVICKTWSETALDELWGKVDNLLRLFHLLVPLVRSRTRFSRHPTASDWVSFQRYTKRVRVLIYDENKHKLSQKLYDDISRTRITLAIFPKLEVLNWRANLRYSLLFMTPTVKRLELYISVDTATRTLSNLANDIVGRMVNLTLLGIHIFPDDTSQSVAPPEVVGGIIGLLTPLRQLHKLVLPRFFFTTRLAELLSTFPKLTRVIFEYTDGEIVGDPDDILIFQPELHHGAYSSLVDIRLCSNYQDSTRFLDLLSSPSILTDLVVESPLPETPLMVHRILDVISKRCHKLRELVLNSTRWGGDNDARERINLKTLEPLFACKTLTLLEIYHHYPFDLKLGDLEKVAKQLSSLEQLHLNDEPGYFGSPKLTLEALLPFARHCLNLKRLGLFINASADAIPEFKSTSPLPVFSKLMELSMGISKISSSTPVAVYLSHLLPKTCQVYGGFGYPALFNLGAKQQKLLEARENLWEEVNPSLSLFIKIREEEREKAMIAMEIMERERNSTVRRVKQELND